MFVINWGINRDVDRIAEVENALNTLDHNPTSTDLEYLAWYILNGLDENGSNQVKRGEIFNPYKKVSQKKDNKLLSLDDTNATPNVDPS